MAEFIHYFIMTLGVVAALSFVVHLPRLLTAVLEAAGEAFYAYRSKAFIKDFVTQRWSSPYNILDCHNKDYKTFSVRGVDTKDVITFSINIKELLETL